MSPARIEELRTYASSTEFVEVSICFEVLDAVEALQARMSQRHIIGKAYEINKETVINLANELDETKKQVEALQAELAQAHFVHQNDLNDLNRAHSEEVDDYVKAMDSVLKRESEIIGEMEAEVAELTNDLRVRTSGVSSALKEIKKLRAALESIALPMRDVTKVTKKQLIETMFNDQDIAREGLAEAEEEPHE